MRYLNKKDDVELLRGKEMTPQEFFSTSETKYKVIEKADVPGLLPRRQADSNKGSFGKLLVIAGSKNMAGAAYFAGKAAYRMGCGLVKLLSAEENRLILQTLLPEAILSTYDKTISQEDVKNELSWPTAVVIGPGLSTSEVAKRLLESLLNYCKVPLLIDADGLNLLAENLDLLENAKCPIVITPHLGEMSRLTKKSIEDIRMHLVNTAETFSKKYDLICHLKDSVSVTADKENCYVQIKENHGMATGGSGDVLSGIIGGLLAQGLEPHLAAGLGARIHAMAGDAAASSVGKRQMMAGDILEGLTCLAELN